MTDNLKNATKVAEETKSGTRTITIVATKGEKKKIEFTGTKWSELRTLVEKAGYDLHNMKAVEGVRKSTLEHDEALVPEQNFNLFLMPYKSKSGHTRSEVYAKIKEAIASGVDASAFSKDGKNYTQLPTDTLIDLLEKNSPGSKKAIAKNKADAITDVVESVKKAANSNEKESVGEQLSSLSANEKLDLVIELLLDIQKSLSGGSNGKAAEIAIDPEVEARRKKEEEEKAEADRLRREEEERKRKEEEELDEELEDIMGGLKDVDRRGRR